MAVEKTLDELVRPQQRDLFEGYVSGANILAGGDDFAMTLNPAMSVDHSWKEGCSYLRDHFLTAYEFPDKAAILLHIIQGQNRTNQILALTVLANLFERAPGIAPEKVDIPLHYRQFEYLPLMHQIEDVCIPLVALDSVNPDEWKSILALRTIITMSQWELRCFKNDRDLQAEAIERHKGLLAKLYEQQMTLGTPQSAPFVAALALKLGQYLYGSRSYLIYDEYLQSTLTQLQFGYLLRMIKGERKTLRQAVQLLVDERFHSRPFDQKTETPYYTQLLLSMFMLADRQYIAPEQIDYNEVGAKHWRGYTAFPAWTAWQEALQIRVSRISVT